jgi:hypothetical protein
MERFKTLEESKLFQKNSGPFMRLRDGRASQKERKRIVVRVRDGLRTISVDGLNEDNSLLAAGCAVPKMPIETKNRSSLVVKQAAPFLFNRSRSPPSSEPGCSTRRKNRHPD